MVRIENLSFAYVPGRRLLENISLDIPPGVVALMGPSGIGKTSLLKILIGIASPEQGDVSIYGAQPSEAAKRGLIGYCPQNASLLPWLTVRENISLPMGIRSNSNWLPFWIRGKHQRRPGIDALLELTHLTAAADLYPHEISGGMKSRCSLARALVMEPRLLLLDEPFSGLDVPLMESILKDLETFLLASAPSVLLVTHDAHQAALLANQVCFLGLAAGDGAATIKNEMTVDLKRPRIPDLVGSPSVEKATGDIMRFARGVAKLQDA
jgi:NitT/TauT family transport system ATP-binding protein